MSDQLLERLFVDGNEVLHVRKLRGLGSPPPRQRLVPLARRHGVDDFTELYGPRLLELDAVLWSSDVLGDVWSALDALKGDLALGSDHVIRFRRRGFAEDEQVTARVASEVSADVDHASPSRLPWSVALLAADPRMYAVAEKLGSYDPTQAPAGSGVALPLVFPLTFPGPSNSHLEALNQGNFSTWPVLTITGPVTGPSVHNDTTGKVLDTTGVVLAAGDTIVLDMAERTLELNGTPRPDLVDPTGTDWFPLVSGTNLLRLAGTGMVGGETALAYSFHDARI